jgi:hypothetical protein
MDGSADDWDRCRYCGRPLGQPPEARFDDEGEPVTSRAAHPECALGRLREPAPPGVRATVRMYKKGERGPLSD